MRMPPSLLLPDSELPSPAAEAARHADLRARARRAMARLEAAADRVPCIVFLGEGNSGKTTAANSLLGDGLLPTAVLANTRFPTLVRYANVPRAEAVLASGRRLDLRSPDAAPREPIALIEVGLPADRLRHFDILDTPAGFDPDDLPKLPGLSPLLISVWCTVATQAWKESERRRWQTFDPRLTRNGVLAVTALDRIDDENARSRLLARLELEAAPLFRTLTYSAMAGGVTTAVPGTSCPALTLSMPSLADRCTGRRRRTVARLQHRLARLAALPAPVRLEALPPPSDLGAGWPP